jgi:hypothetical protein
MLVDEHIEELGAVRGGLPHAHGDRDMDLRAARAESVFGARSLVAACCVNPCVDKDAAWRSVADDSGPLKVAKVRGYTYCQRSEIGQFSGS